MLVVHLVEEQSSIEDYFHFAICLAFYVIAPKKGPNTPVEGTSYNHFLPIFEEVYFVQVGNCLFNVLGASEVHFVLFV